MYDWEILSAQNQQRIQGDRGGDTAAGSDKGILAGSDREPNGSDGGALDKNDAGDNSKPQTANAARW
eukprot:CAMPEP_0119037952 /NCGR_PEP_ID=MMETSP1177-20130426/6544_1 /TAXON_ID=2985 /ORGANISM="Ochromonas sp, Strain CCMP1899" /LENGTH=66 /DNA_ID=CAMNT_0006999833 /DNA_START=959 /DNA_END=1156 /DNA_ORIENTATION=-